MTLYEYLQDFDEWDEVVAWDKDYDIEIYFYKKECDQDAWDKAIADLEKLLTVEQIKKGGVVVNLAEIIEKKLHQLEKAKLFVNCDINNIMVDMENILAGYVSEEWLTEFVGILRK